MFVMEQRVYSEKNMWFNDTVIWNRGIKQIALCNMFSFRQFPGILVLIADVSEPSIGSIFMGRWMKNDYGWDVRCIYAWRGCGRKVAGPMEGRVTGRSGWSHNRLWKGEALYIYIKSSPITGLDRPRGFQEVKVPRFHDNGTGWW
jgi:hypothetical protein